MTARTAAAIASVAVLASFGCMNFYEVPIETPIRAKIDVTPFQRVLVAGFLAGGTSTVDANTETTRLLRSQLRSRSEMKVVDADVLALNDAARRFADGVVPAGNGQDAGGIRTEADLQPYEQIFSDQPYWKKIGDEFQGPLIVTGSVVFTEVSRSGMVSKPQEYVDGAGRRQVMEVREWVDRKGFVLVPKFVFIDGRTGQQLYSETFREETTYASTQNTPALSSYFELMDKLLPSFLNTLSTQKIRGTRVLIR